MIHLRAGHGGHGRRSDAGQTLVETAILLPILLMVSLGLVETSYAILHQHVISRITREGANLISRDVTLLDASNALKTMSAATGRDRRTVVPVQPVDDDDDTWTERK